MAVFTRYKLAGVEPAYPDYKSSAFTSKLLLNLLCVSFCQNKAQINPAQIRAIALPSELQPHKLGLTGIEPATHGIIAVRAFTAACRNRTYRLLITNQVHNQPAQAA